MKQYPISSPLAASLACILLLALTACTPQALEELAPAPDAAPAPLTISVSDGGHSSATQTRAEEKNFTTVFTDGDRIGLYVVKDGEIKRSNLCLTLLNGKWTLPTKDTPQLVYAPGTSYYAYYPYKDDTYMDGNVSASSSGNDFFAPLVASWQPTVDQSTHDAYTASDLMTAQGECSNANGNYTLHFPMKHRMGMLLVKFAAPKVNNSDLKVHQETWMLNEYENLRVNNGAMYYNKGYRYLINPAGNKGTYELKYRNGTEHSYKFEAIPDGGKYQENILDGQGDVNFNSLIGDYYMDDGTIADGFYSVMPEGCIGIIFSDADPTAQDSILARDHPNCTHGLVIALKNVAAKNAVWSEAHEYVNNWTNSEDRGADKVNIRNDTLKQGYANTLALRAYNQAYPDKEVVPVKHIDGYAVACPPESSGWYWPSISDLKELANSGIITTADFQKAGGESLDTYYWTSSEYDTMHGIYGMLTPSFASTGYDKSSRYNVRAILAF